MQALRLEDMRRRWPRGWAAFVVVISVAAVVLTLLNVGLLGLVLAGLAIGWAVRSVFLRDYRKALAIAIGCLTVGVVVSLGLRAVFYTTYLASAPVDVIEAVVGVQAEYDENAATWRIRERIALEPARVEAAVKSIEAAIGPTSTATSTTTAEEREALISEDLADEGWVLSEQREGRLVFERQRDLAMPAQPFRTEMQLEAPRAYLAGRFIVVPGAGSVMALTTPARMIRSSSPATSTRMPAGALERVDIAIGPVGGFDVETVHLSVDGWAGRLPGVHELLNVSFGSGIGWLLLIGLAVAQDDIRSFVQRPFSRFRTTKPAPSTEPRTTKVLFLAASPSNAARLGLDVESRAIDEALRETDFGQRFEVEQQWAVQIGDLQDHLLRHRPDIVHFSGHGSKASEIVLENEDRTSYPVPQEALGELFGILKDNVRCVVLNACYSERQAMAIAAHIDCVVGMTTAIGDKAAIEFATAFYAGLGYGKDVQTAFQLGVNRIDLVGLDEGDTPKLLDPRNKAATVKFGGEIPSDRDQLPVLAE